MTTPDLKDASWLTRLRLGIARRLRRFLFHLGVVAVVVMMAAPTAAMGDGPEAESHEVAVEQVHPWDGTELDEPAWHNSTLLLPPLYLRIPEPQLLNSTIRASIHTFVSHNPGATFTEVRASVGAATGTVQHHLRVLVRGGVLRRVRTGKYTRYYPHNHRVLALPPSQETLVSALVDGGPATKAELARRTGMSRQLVHYHVERMADRGLVVVDRGGRSPVVRLGAPVD